MPVSTKTDIPLDCFAIYFYHHLQRIWLLAVLAGTEVELELELVDCIWMDWRPSGVIVASEPMVEKFQFRRQKLYNSIQFRRGNTKKIGKALVFWSRNVFQNCCSFSTNIGQSWIWAGEKLWNQNYCWWRLTR